MTKSGRVVLEELDAQVKRLSADVDSRRESDADAQSEVRRRMEDVASSYRDLAVHYLPELTEEVVRVSLPIFQEQARVELSAKRARRNTLRGAVTQDSNALQIASDRIEAINLRMDQLRVSRDELTPRVEDHLAASDEYQAGLDQRKALRGELADAEFLHERAIERYNANTDRFNTDPDIDYFFNRGFFSGDRKGLPWMRWLDDRYAEAVGLETERFKLGLQDSDSSRQEERQQEIVGDIQGVDEHLGTLLRAAQKEHGLDVVLAESSALAYERENLLDEIDTTRTRYNEANAELRDLRSDNGAYHHRAVESAIYRLTGMSMVDVKALVEMTDGEDDDALYRALEESTAELEEARVDAEYARNNLSDAEDKLAELQKLQSWFRRKRYDGSYSEFPDDYDVGDAVTDYLHGRILLDALQGGISRNHTRNTPVYDSPSSSSGGSGYDWYGGGGGGIDFDFGGGGGGIGGFSGGGGGIGGFG